MPNVSRRLPEQPHLDVPKHEARELLRDWRAALPEALERVGHSHPRFRDTASAAIASGPCRLSDAQLVLAREYGFATWAELKHRIELHPVAHELERAIRANERDQVVTLLRANPALLHLPVRSGNWGPPLSHAANLGRLEIVQAIAALGARDTQHAFDRALLQGRIECARWLHAHGGTAQPGSLMGVCETLNPAGLRLLIELGTRFTDQHGNRLAPLALVLQTYARNPAAKHEVLALFARQGYHFPDTPLMAFHRGDVARLTRLLQDDPTQIHHRFTYREIYPPELGCADDGRSGLHGTPLAGTTLLHLAIDFDEQEIFDRLLALGADVNARAERDAASSGTASDLPATRSPLPATSGHTPLFNSVVSCAYINGRQRDAAMTRALLERGADPELRASLRKFLDWRETPGWHEAQHVTAAAWARGFPETTWVNPAALELLEKG